MGTNDERRRTAVGDVGYGEAVGGVVRVGLEVDPQVASAGGERERRRRRLARLVRRQRVRRRCMSRQHTPAGHSIQNML